MAISITRFLEELTYSYAYMNTWEKAYRNVGKLEKEDFGFRTFDALKVKDRTASPRSLENLTSSSARSANAKTCSNRIVCSDERTSTISSLDWSLNDLDKLAVLIFSQHDWEKLCDFLWYNRTLSFLLLSVPFSSLNDSHASYQLLDYQREIF